MEYLLRHPPLLLGLLLAAFGALVALGVAVAIYSHTLEEHEAQGGVGAGSGNARGSRRLFLVISRSFGVWLAVLALIEPLAGLLIDRLAAAAPRPGTLDVEAGLAWNASVNVTGRSLAAFPLPLSALASAALAVAAILAAHAALFARPGQRMRLATLVAERLAVLLGFAVFASYLVQFQVLQAYYSVAGLLGPGWAQLRFTWSNLPWIWRLNMVDGLVHEAWVRALSLCIGAGALWYAYRPVPRALKTLAHVVRPYLSRRFRRRGLAAGMERCVDRGGKCDLVLFADLHLETGAGTLQKGLDSAAVLPWIAWVVASSEAKGILILGDVTDTGDGSAWERAAAHFRDIAVERAAVPGNHDIHFRRLARGDAAPGWLRHWLSIVVGLGEPGSSYRPEVVYSRLAHLEARRTGRAGFPRLHSYHGVPADVLLLDSNLRPSSWPVTNALGAVGPAQLQEARRLLATRRRRMASGKRERTLLVALHHHIIPAAGIEAPLLMCLDYLQVLDLAAEYGAAAIVHGHTHMPYACQFRHRSASLRIVSCGSALFPATGPWGAAVRDPSCFGLRFAGGRLQEGVVLYSRPLASPPAGA